VILKRNGRREKESGVEIGSKWKRRGWCNPYYPGNPKGTLKEAEKKESGNNFRKITGWH